MFRAIRGLSMAAVVAVVAILVVASASDAFARGRNRGGSSTTYVTQVVPVVRVYQPVYSQPVYSTPVYSTPVYTYRYPTTTSNLYTTTPVYSTNTLYPVSDGYPTAHLVMVPFPY